MARHDQFLCALRKKLDRLVSCRYVVFLTIWCLWPTIRARRTEELEDSLAQVPTRHNFAKVGPGQVLGGDDEPEVFSWPQGEEKGDSLESGGAGTWRLQIPSIVETFEMIRCSEEASFANGKVTTRIIDWRISENALRALSCPGRGVKHAMQRAPKTTVSWRK